MRCAILVAAMSVALLKAQSGGIPAEWDVQKRMSALVEHVQRFDSVLAEMHAEEWVKKGAPQAYVAQVARTRTEIGYLVGSSQELAAHPERMTMALETFFRMESVDAMLRSLAGGVRKYQSAAMGDELDGAIADAAADRSRLRQYLVELAADREQQFKVMDQEAQRCRAALARPTPAAKPAARQEGKR
jgi:hypothetical protein